MPYDKSKRYGVSRGRLRELTSRLVPMSDLKRGDVFVFGAGAREFFDKRRYRVISNERTATRDFVHMCLKYEDVRLRSYIRFYSAAYGDLVRLIKSR